MSRSHSNSFHPVPVPLAKKNGKLSPAAKQPSQTETLGTQGELGELGMDQLLTEIFTELANRPDQSISFVSVAVDVFVSAPCNFFSNF